MFSLSPSELASLTLLGDLLMNPLAARTSSLVLLRVSLQEDKKVSITSVPLLTPTLPSKSHPWSPDTGIRLGPGSGR